MNKCLRDATSVRRCQHLTISRDGLSAVKRVTFAVATHRAYRPQLGDFLVWLASQEELYEGMRREAVNYSTSAYEPSGWLEVRDAT